MNKLTSQHQFFLRVKASVNFRLTRLSESILLKLYTFFPQLRSYFYIPLLASTTSALAKEKPSQISNLEVIIPPESFQAKYQTKHLPSDPTRSWFHLDQEITVPHKLVCQIPHGRIFGNCGAIMTADHTLLSDLSLDFNLVSEGLDSSHHYIFQLAKLPPPTFLDANVACCVTPAGGNNYFHWMIDVLPKLYLLEQSSISWEKIDYWVFNTLQFSFCQETLSRLRIPQNRIVEISGETHLQAKNLICTSSPSITNDGRVPISRWIINFLRDQFLLNSCSDAFRVDPPKRIWISRMDSSRRSISNEQEVIDFLEPFGFISVKLSSLSVLEQATLFNQSEVVIAPHGAGLTNLVFCKPGTKVIEIFLPPDVNGRWSGIGDYCYLSNQLNLSYFYMLSDEVSEFQVKVNWNARKMVINLQKLLKVLQLVELI